MSKVEKLQVVEIAEIYPTAVWIENDFCGNRLVMLQHQGCEPFEYARFGYDYRYTSNAGTHWEAVEMAKRLGAKEPVEERARPWKFPSADELREQIKSMQETLAEMEKEEA